MRQAATRKCGGWGVGGGEGGGQKQGRKKRHAAAAASSSLAQFQALCAVTSPPVRPPALQVTKKVTSPLPTTDAIFYAGTGMLLVGGYCGRWLPQPLLACVHACRTRPRHPPLSAPLRRVTGP